MTAILGEVVADPRQTIAELQRQLEECRAERDEALQRETATAEVLQVINSSTGDLAPVFDAILEKAHTLCGSESGSLQLWDGDSMLVVARAGRSPFTPGERRRLAPNAPDQRLIAGESVVQIADIGTINDAPARASAASGNRTVLFVALRRDSELLGYITATRSEVRPFSDKQIALLQNFAAQAVIAIENARLITETREALDQQTATAEVLGVINSSPGDLAPVFETILEKAHALCGATLGSLYLFDGETFRPAAAVGYLEGSAPLREIKTSEDPRLAALRDGARLTHVADLSQLDDPVARAVAARGVRTNLLLPLRQEGTLLGVITCNRHEVRPFAAKEIALLENFAAQAVIAMDNARLLDEIRQRQAELRVTFDNMGDGVAMFDDKMRLAAWNMNFQKILDLPDDFVAGRPSLKEYFQYMSARGEYGTATPEVEAEIRHGVTIAERESRFERTRPDGTVIEVRRNAVPGGGSVLIFSDITERKRAEAEIHAARDAAERALGELKLVQANLIQAEKMASLGQLTAGIAHEIKNPLNFVNNFAGLSIELLDELKETAAPAIATLNEDARAEIDETVEMLTSNLDKIAEHGQRADNIVKSMLEHSRGVSGDRRRVDLNTLIDEALNLAYHGARAQDQSFNIALECDYTPLLKPIELAPQEITRVFLNIIGNGFYAATKRARENGKGSFQPTLSVATRDLGEAIEVKVRDNGTGIAPEIRDKLFQPFFTTKPTGEGTGLGLSISYDIVTQQHGGTIEVDSQVGEFTEFIVLLPRGFGAVAR